MTPKKGFWFVKEQTIYNEIEELLNKISLISQS